MISVTCLRSCRHGCSKRSVGHGCIAACCGFRALLKLGLLTLQTVPHCHSTHWGEGDIMWHINKVIFREIWRSIVPKSLKGDDTHMGKKKERNLCSWTEKPTAGAAERDKNKGEKVGPWQGQGSGQLWQHRSLFPAPPLLPRSQCKGVLLNHTHHVQLP